jgi:hypothetical protein
MFFNEPYSIISSLTLLFAGRERSGHLTGFHTGCGPPNRYSTYSFPLHHLTQPNTVLSVKFIKAKQTVLMSFTVKKVIIFPVPSQDATNKIIPGRE